MKLLILSDIHGNWPALEAILQTETDFDTVAFCGDVVDYGPCPIECIRWLREHANQCVRGNHDNALAFDEDCRCMGSFRECSLATRAWHRTLVDESDRQYLGALPTVNRFEYDGHSFRMAHANPQGDMFEYLAMDQWCDRVQGLSIDDMLLGHTHIQGIRSCGEITVVNPGSVGLARDGSGQACYATYSEGRFELKRIPYDVERTIALLEKAPLPEHVIGALANFLHGDTNTSDHHTRR